MTTFTKVVWADGTPGETAANEIAAQAALMASQGKTDDTFTMETNVPAPGQRTITRDWTTLADAEEWITFVLNYSPVSAEVLP